MDKEMIPNPKPYLLLVVVGLIASFLVGRHSASDFDKDVDYIARTNIRDSIILSQEYVIGELYEKIKGRDSLIAILSTVEKAKRDTIFDSLEDKFEGSDENDKNRLIEEALNSIK